MTSLLVKELDVDYRLEKCTHSPPKFKYYDLFIESNVLGTDDRVYEMRHSAFLGCVYENTIGSYIRLAKKKDVYRHMPLRIIRLAIFWPPIRLYLDMDQRQSTKPVKRIREHIAFITAPRHETNFDGPFMDYFSKSVKELLTVHKIMDA